MHGLPAWPASSTCIVRPLMFSTKRGRMPAGSGSSASDVITLAPQAPGSFHIRHLRLASADHFRNRAQQEIVMAKLPLEHLTVLDLNLHSAVPKCARQYASWGAKVLKHAVLVGPKVEAAGVI